MSEHESATTEFVVTRTGLFYHRPQCQQIRRWGRTSPYEPGMERTDPSTGQLVNVQPCRVCRPDEARDLEHAVEDDEQFSRLMWSMLGAAR